MIAPAQRNVAIGISAALVNVLFWGIAPAVIKFGLDSVSPFIFLYYRFLFVIVITTPFLFIFRKKFATIKTPKDLLIMLGIGLLTNPLSLGVLFVGLQYTTSAAGSILAGISPLFIVFASAMFLKERITKFEVFGSLLATAGTAFIVLDTPIQAHASNPLLGNILVVSYNIIWATGVLLMKKYAQKHSPFLFGYTGWFTGFIVFAVAALMTNAPLVLRPLALTQIPDALFPILYMAIFGSVVAFTAYQVAQQHLEASHVSIFTYLQPLVTVPLAYFWLKERFGLLFIFGAIVLTIGVIVAEIHPRSRLHAVMYHKNHYRRFFARIRKKRPVGRLRRA
ncbi:MAG TPA: DMT family transporter [Patescibacteria group bacterium]|nr:DMT family transporter [Patescibacteria group bacterium]